MRDEILTELSSVGIGCAVALWLYDMNSDLQTSKAAFILFIGRRFP